MPDRFGHVVERAVAPVAEEAIAGTRPGRDRAERRRPERHRRRASRRRRSRAGPRRPRWFRESAGAALRPLSNVKPSPALAASSTKAGCQQLRGGGPRRAAGCNADCSSGSISEKASASVTLAMRRSASRVGFNRASACAAARSVGACRARRVHQPRASNRRPSASARVANSTKWSGVERLIHHLAIAIFGRVELCLAAAIISGSLGLSCVPGEKCQSIHGPRIVDSHHHLLETHDVPRRYCPRVTRATPAATAAVPR